jgi:hypothetical protein
MRSVLGTEVVSRYCLAQITKRRVVGERWVGMLVQRLISEGREKHPSADWQLEVAPTPLRALDIMTGRDIERLDCGTKLEKVNAN